MCGRISKKFSRRTGAITTELHDTQIPKEEDKEEGKSKNSLLQGDSGESTTAGAENNNDKADVNQISTSSSRSIHHHHRYRTIINNADSTQHQSQCLDGINIIRCPAGLTARCHAGAIVYLPQYQVARLHHTTRYPITRYLPGIHVCIHLIYLLIERSLSLEININEMSISPLNSNKLNSSK